MLLITFYFYLDFFYDVAGGGLGFVSGRLDGAQEKFKLIKAIDAVIIHGVAICGKFALFVPVTERERAYSQICGGIFDGEVFSFHRHSMLL